jgi:hypothetical protein
MIYAKNFRHQAYISILYFSTPIFGNFSNNTAETCFRTAVYYRQEAETRAEKP